MLQKIIEKRGLPNAFAFDEEYMFSLHTVATGKVRTPSSFTLTLILEGRVLK